MTDASLEMSKKLHRTDKSYGLADAYRRKDSIKGHLKIPEAIGEATKYSTINSLLDYGTGQGGLVSLLKSYTELSGINIQGFDPGVEVFSKRPNQKFDIVTCIDVLEHIDREAIGDVIKDISKFVDCFLFFAVDLIPAQKILADGRNAHILLAPADWWSQQISAQFSFTRFLQVGETLSGLRSPVKLFGWASNDRFAYKAANNFLDSIKLLQMRWIITDEGGGVIKFTP